MARTFDARITVLNLMFKVMALSVEDGQAQVRRLDQGGLWQVCVGAGGAPALTKN
jgi:hypothetical protein